MTIATVVTVAELCRKYGLDYLCLSDGLAVFIGSGRYPDLWHCDDYAVSSVSCGVCWMVRK